MNEILRREIDQILNLNQFNLFMESHQKEKEFENVFSSWKNKSVPDKAPMSAESAYLLQRLTLKVEWNSIDNALQASWQNYWLACCRSDKCNYVFYKLAAYDVDREEDILQIFEKENFWSYVDLDKDKPPGGKAYYLRECIIYLLHRFSVGRTFRLWKKNKKIAGAFGVFSLLLPRLLGVIIIGAIFVNTITLLWELPARWASAAYYWWGLPLSLFVMLLLSILFLIYDFRKKTEYFGFKELLQRVGCVFSMGMVESFLVNLFIVISIRPALLSLPSHFGSFSPDLWITSISLTIEALFIGIFMQSFWEEKTISEPL